MVEFWWVYAEGTTSAPTKRHTNAVSARDEALRLAGRTPGQTFIVFHSIGSALLDAPKAEWRDADDADIPF